MSEHDRILGHADSGLHKPMPAASGRVSDVQVLVADDNEDAAWGVAKLLEIMGYRTLIAAGGRQALELAALHAPAVLLLDVGMPDLDGHAAARQLRAAANGAAPILLAMTGWGQESDVRRSLDAGFDAHLTKPIDPGQVSQLIEELLALRRGEIPPAA